MSENTKIEWATHTLNPWIGCTQIGPGCDNCFAKAEWDDRRHRVVWGAGQQRSRTKTWGDPLKWNGQHEAFFAKHGHRQKVFCASLADVFDNEVPQAWRDDLFRLIAQTPNLDWLLLTKRIGNANLMIGDALLQEPRLLSGPCRATGWPWPNVWLGATICNQAEADRDIAKLLAVPAAKRFLSMEPLLGPVDLSRWLEPAGLDTDLGLSNAGLDWVIVGGESGSSARPMHPDWARSLRDQCQAAGVPFMFKQWGEFVPASNEDCDPGYGPRRYFWSDGKQWQRGDGQRGGVELMCKVGKKAAGRMLDGCECDGVPV